MATTSTKTTKTTPRRRAASRTPRRAARSNAAESRWQELRPEWATEGLERVGARVEKLAETVQSRGDELRVEGRRRLEQTRERLEEALERAERTLRETPAFQRVEALREDLGKRVEKNVDASVDRVYESLKLARVDELKRLERKIAQLNRKLVQLEKRGKSAA